MFGRRSDRTTDHDLNAHDVFYGPVGSGKTSLARTYMEEDDLERDGVETWVIDPFLAMAECRHKVDRYVREFGEIDETLAFLLAETYSRAELIAGLGIKGFAVGDQRHDLPLISVTIADADAVLRDLRRGRAVEQVMRMSRRAGIKFRLVVLDLSLLSFGSSEVIRSSAVNGNVLACEKASA
ncbi:hypothetical protein [Actinomadura decatromicini]|uniref:AAA family ATPase n=1 Tax=Actinomadura decatromicini TaxID=2604572 RepID=A0A5D3FA84_9ACTN|nr:hypothetical protein [Actinomadura decatromicini]TYK45113.1 hypothetical protein FXF68_31000 [Actinomadura decatromicini]